jgi:hypothetical protein
MKRPRQRQLVLDRAHLIQMLSDPAFFEQCPDFRWLQETALLQAAAYYKSEEKNCCGGNWKIMAPIVNGFFDSLRTLHAADPTKVQQIRDYLAAKKGYIAKPIVIFYRPADNSGPRRFMF